MQNLFSVPPNSAPSLRPWIAVVGLDMLNISIIAVLFEIIPLNFIVIPSHTLQSYKTIVDAT